MTSSVSPFEKVQHQETTDAAGKFSFRSEGRQIRVTKIDGPGEWLYDLDVGTSVAGEPNRSNAIYKGGGNMTVPYRVKPDFPAVFVLVSKDQPIAVMPQRGGDETLASGRVMDNGPVFPRRPSIPLTSDPVMRTGRQRASWVPPRDKAHVFFLKKTLEHEIKQRLDNSTQLRAVIGHIKDSGSPSWQYRQRSIEGMLYRKLSASWMINGDINRAYVEVVVHLTPKGYRPVVLLVRPDTAKGRLAPIPLWTQEEIDHGLAKFTGTATQRDALFDGWQSNDRASVNVVKWMSITRPIYLPYSARGSDEWDYLLEATAKRTPTLKTPPD